MILRTTLGVVLFVPYIMIPDIVANNKFNDDVSLVTFTEKYFNNLSQKEDDILLSDDEINRELFKTNILREAYDLACVKLALHLCYSACNRVLRNYCTVRRCSRRFKSEFRGSSKTGCIDAFNARNISKRHRKGSTTTTQFTPVEDPDTGTDCDEANRKMGELRVETIGYLRAHYDRDCCRHSSKRCNSACNYALKTTCDKYKCDTKLKKKFIDNCKKYCRITYKDSKKKPETETETSSSTESETSLSTSMSSE